jgi:hypothetical protein
MLVVGDFAVVGVRADGSAAKQSPTTSTLLQPANHRPGQFQSDECVKNSHSVLFHSYKDAEE